MHLPATQVWTITVDERTVTLKAEEEESVYTIPAVPAIGDGPASQKLYRLEHKTCELVKNIAHELSEILGHSDGQFWDRSLPEALAGILASFERGGAIAAAIGFLRYEGLDVQPTSHMTERFGQIREVIEHVENRCLAADGPVTKTCDEITDDELIKIYTLAGGKVQDDGDEPVRSEDRDVQPDVE